MPMTSMVREARLELARYLPQHFKCCASADSAIPAYSHLRVCSTSSSVTLGSQFGLRSPKPQPRPSQPSSAASRSKTRTGGYGFLIATTKVMDSALIQGIRFVWTNKGQPYKTPWSQMPVLPGRLEVTNLLFY